MYAVDCRRSTLAIGDAMLTKVRGRSRLFVASLAAFSAACSDAGSVTSGDGTRQTLTLATASAPEAPSLMSATAASATQINLKWQDNSSTETGFQIES
ncbi:MAG: hypothetical protein JWM95_1478, partial [Gemmatimonadetes bacterium]|nr:hypothetical protein [Gemmatimonadota bacterium]